MAPNRSLSLRGHKKKTAEPTSRGLTAVQVAAQSPPTKVDKLQQAIEEVGGKVLGTYREPLEGHWHVLASLPIDKVTPTPFQRDLSETHVGRLADVIDRTRRFLDPIVVVQNQHGAFWTPNGHHRLAAMQRLGARDHRRDRARCRGRLPDLGTEHGEGAQPPREIAGGDPHGAFAGGPRPPGRKRSLPWSSRSLPF